MPIRFYNIINVTFLVVHILSVCAVAGHTHPINSFPWLTLPTTSGSSYKFYN